MKKLFLTLFLAACAPVGTLPSPSPTATMAPAFFPTANPTPQAPAATLKADWSNSEWTAELSKAIEELGPSLQTEECQDRVQYFTMLFSALSRFESGFDPKETYTEAFPDKNGVRVVSRGLFQLSIESVNGARYKCGIKKADELHDPAINIRCAVKVANAIVKENGVVTGGTSGAWKGMARYWSPFRKASKRDAILAKAKASCQ